jgi:hypothetical protein
MKDFNIAKYLKEHNLGSHGILGRYVDLHALKEEEVGNNKPVSKVPYEGSDAKLDGFGDKFDQVQSVSELEKPEQIYSNDWMDDSIDGKKVGNWTCYYEYPSHVIYWIHDQINSEDVVVYATPGWDGAPGIACETSVEHGEATIDHETIGENSYPDFESYAQDVAPYLKKVQDKYFAGEYDTYLGGGAGNELAEEETNAVATIDLQMQWDLAHDAAVRRGFDEYGIEVEETGEPGEYEVTGRKEDIIAYLKSDYFGKQDDEWIKTYYPELLDGGSDLEEDDSSLFGPSIEKSRPGSLSDYYRSAEPTVKHVAKELDEILAVLIQDKSRLEELTDLIVALADAYSEK